MKKFYYKALALSILKRMILKKIMEINKKILAFNKWG